MVNFTITYRTAFVATLMLAACQGPSGSGDVSDGADPEDSTAASPEFLTEPLVSDLYTADPSAHVFDGTLYIYPSHDVESGIPQDDLGSHFDMKDYHVYSMEQIEGDITDHGIALSVDQVPWAERQMWAPDAALRDGTYYLYFPAKDPEGVFRIGVASSSSPTGPFEPDPNPIEGSYSIDPAVYKDAEGEYYMYLGGIWGGQLQRWSSGEYNPEDEYPDDDQPALSPKVARLSDDMRSFSEELRDVELLDENGEPLTAGDNQRRFFEAPWVHKFEDTYYFSYSTGDTHFIAYATGDNPYGPFTYQGVVLNPVLGWTNHHSIVEFNGKWYLFYHDTEISGGQTHLRNIKMTELTHRPDGSIVTINP